MQDDHNSFEFHPLKQQLRFKPNRDPMPAGTREVFEFYTLNADGSKGKVLDEIPATWQEDGTVILDRHFELKLEIIDIIFSPPKTEKPRPTRPVQKPTVTHDDHKERMERRKQFEIKHYGKEVARRKSSARWRAEKGEDAVPYRYYKAVNRVLVRKDALERDFDKTYDYVCDVLGPDPVIAIDEDEFLHFARKK